VLWHSDSGVDEMPSGHLVADMETVRDSLWKKHGSTLLGLHWNLLQIFGIVGSLKHTQSASRIFFYSVYFKLLANFL